VHAPWKLNIRIAKRVTFPYLGGRNPGIILHINNPHTAAGSPCAYAYSSLWSTVALMLSFTASMLAFELLVLNTSSPICCLNSLQAMSNRAPANQAKTS
jgi:hypothetical protein